MRDPSEFRERFKAYKNGKSVREIYGLPGYAPGKVGEPSSDEVFVEQMGPLLYRELLYQGVENPDVVYKNLIAQLAYESDRGRSRLAKQQHNYGGVGYNNKTGTYFRYNNDADFVHDYVKLMNRRYKSAISADTLYEYAKRIRNLGYYEDTLENYSRNLIGMKSLHKAALAHKNANPDLYKVERVPTQQMSPTIAPSVSTRVDTTIPQEKTIPIVDTRNATMAEALRAMWAHNVMEDMKGAYQVPIWESPSLPALTPVEYDVTPMRYKNGKLPGYGGGKISMGAKRNLTEEELNTALQNVLHEQGMSGEDPLMSMLVGMKAVRLVGDLLALRRLKERAEMYKRWREANELTRDASRAWKMLDADRMARNWGYSDNPLGFLYDVFLDPVANLYTKILKHPVLGPLIPFSDGKLPGYSNGKIRIKPANRGKFNATKKRTGKTTEELTHSKNPLTRKRAIFALNARKWNHK